MGRGGSAVRGKWAEIFRGESFYLVFLGESRERWCFFPLERGVQRFLGEERSFCLVTLGRDRAAALGG